MCATCGCSDSSRPKLTNLETGLTIALDDPQGHEHSHSHPHPHDHSHSHGHSHASDHDHHEHAHHHLPAHSGTTISVEAAVLAKNDRLAERNRGWLAGRDILALNLVSSPGAGKTTLLERTIRDLSGELSLSVIEGDQETLNDAERIRATGCRVVQINTGTGCHLDAAMLARGLDELNPPLHSLVMIENVGNLVCPALFDLGERAKVVIASVTEGDDKPLKYPHMFRASTIVLLNKIDLLPYVPFNEARFLDSVRQVNPSLRVLRVSATTGDGLPDWYEWLRVQVSLGLSVSTHVSPRK
ncbi:hydrogenase nickel incorporation protein HypB [Singulisphaera sp. Ch08]|uniref:Hydrogenase nickel incorporation protein HypB n=1 Tax=Singulisphaera sp. Ch08 TaxID=3120278 RepID=A0AAU7CTS8_9BACT